MKRLLVLFSIIHQCWALNCSDPVTLSELSVLSIPSILSERQGITLNDKGLAAIAWKDMQDDDEVVKIAFKDSGQWLPPFNIPQQEEASGMQYHIDASGNIFAFWKVWDFDHDKIYIWGVEKRKEGEWNQPKVLAEYEDDAFVSFAPRNGKCLVFSVEKQENSVYLKSEELSFSSEASQGTPPLFLKTAQWFDNDDIVIATNKESKQYALWLQEREEGKIVFHGALFKGDGSWGPIEEISLSESNLERVSFYGLQLFMDTQENVCVIARASYLDDSERIVSWMRSLEGEWSEPVFLSLAEEDLSDLHLVGDEKGNFMASWMKVEKKKPSLFTAYKPFGQSWNESIQLTPLHEVNFQSILQTDLEGNFVLVWQQLKNWKHLAVHGASFSTASRRWSSSKQLSPVMRNCLLGSFALQEKGGGILTWIVQENLSELTLQAAEVSVDS